MEIIRGNKPRRQKTSGYIVAVIFIIVGLLFLGKNLEIIDAKLFRIFVSWQMLLIVLGLWSVFRKQYFGGIILLSIGVFFMIPRLTYVSHNWIHTYWPLIFVILGVLILLKRKKPDTVERKKKCVSDIPHLSEDGFLNSENTFGAVRHIVLDPVFKGASIKNTFASTVIDLRRTALVNNETFIDVDCTFGGIEVYVPNNWCVISEIKPVFGGFEDKRHQSMESIDNEHKLIIRGNLNFSGLEVKS